MLPAASRGVSPATSTITLTLPSPLKGEGGGNPAASCGESSHGAILAMSSIVQYVNRETGAVVTEQRHDTRLLQYFYGDEFGSQLMRRLVRRHLISKIYGWWFSRKVGTRKLEKFVKQFRIDMCEAEKPLGDYASCNEVFTRRLKANARPVQTDPSLLISPADCSMTITPALQGTRLFIKGGSYTLGELIEDDTKAKRYEGGSIAIFRLAPADYHRFHFPDGGNADAPRRIPGHLDSVSSQALEYDPAIFCRNQRDIVEFNSDGFGRMLIIPIGATIVGKIVETYNAGPVVRGQEQGYFEIGGSSIVIVLEKDKVVFDEDLIANRRKGLETTIKMGTRIGATPRPCREGVL